MSDSLRHITFPGVFARSRSRKLTEYKNIGILHGVRSNPRVRMIRLSRL
jgi:hypothetical protein